jgi:hypothetical protein
MKNRIQGINILLARQAKRRSRSFIEARLRSMVTKRELKQAREFATQINFG